MTVFKVGDTVIRMQGSHLGMQVGDIDTVRVVLDRGYDDAAMYYLGLEKYQHQMDAHASHDSGNFLLWTEEDEPLPPVPDSVRYEHRSLPLHMIVEPSQISEGIKIVVRGANPSVNMYLDAEDAIQLAYDIKRMARKLIKDRG